MIEIEEKLAKDERDYFKNFLIKNGYEKTPHFYERVFQIGKNLKGREYNIRGKNFKFNKVMIKSKYHFEVTTYLELGVFSNYGGVSSCHIKSFPLELQDTILEIHNLFKPYGLKPDFSGILDVTIRENNMNKIFRLTKDLPLIAKRAEAFINDAIKEKGRM